MDHQDPRRSLRVLHDELDRQLAPLHEAHRKRLRCSPGCHDCCVDELTVFEVEAQRIRTDYREVLETQQPHPPGACAFLDSGGRCRIYSARPYVCRTQGLPLRWLDEQDGATVEFRDICPLNETPDEPLETLGAEQCWELGPFEARLRAVQESTGSGDLRRVRLRDLFRSR